MGKKAETHLNYIYFTLLFISLSWLHIYHISLIEGGGAIHRAFYIIYAIGQCILEVGVLALIGRILIDRFPRVVNIVFIVMTFVLFLMHILDFPLVSIMNMSIWYVLDFVADESFENFIEMLYASNISLKTWIMGGLVGLLFPVLGLIFFRLTHSIARRRPFKFTYPAATLSLLAVVLFLSLFDFKTGKLAAPENQSRYVQALPWKTTLFSASLPLLPLKDEGRALRPILSEEAALAKLSGESKQPLRRPNIHIFIIESLREDVICKEVAPAMANFRKENISFENAYAASDCTNSSWFSIFHARYPFYWGQMRPEHWKSGSLPLKILKKAGYKIHVYSSARFGYYQMDQVLFGTKKDLVDELHVFPQGEGVEAWQTDTQCFEKLRSDMQEWDEGGHVSLVFCDATHFDYSWPKSSALETVVPQINYLKVACHQSDVEGIKNRYRNAVHYVDMLFGGFIGDLYATDEGKQSVVVLTGDHAEEFFEQGHIFHLSNLNEVQTRVPIYFRFGMNNQFFSPPEIGLVSHLDIFPTLLDYVYGSDHFTSYFDGESIFRERKKNYVVSTKYNASRSPYEFFIHNGKSKLLLRFLNQKEIEQSPALQIVGQSDLNDRNMIYDLPSIERQFGKPLLDLFPKE